MAVWFGSTKSGRATCSKLRKCGIIFPGNFYPSRTKLHACKYLEALLVNEIETFVTASGDSFSFERWWCRWEIRENGLKSGLAQPETEKHWLPMVERSC